MNKQTIILVLLLAVVAVVVVLFITLRTRSPIKRLRNRVIQRQEQADAAAAELERTDRITTVLCGTGSPISQTGPQTSTAVFVNGQFLLFDAGNNTLSSMNGLNPVSYTHLRAHET